MPRFSANISTLFKEHDFLARPAAAAKAGFRGIEIQFPYEFEAPDWLQAIRKARVEVALINVPAGDLTQGGPGLAAMPGREAEFRAAVETCAHYAKALGVERCNVLSGAPPPALGRERCMEIFVQNLELAARILGDVGVQVVIEAVNTRDRPGFLISTSAEALQAIDWAGKPNVALQYDFYHMQIMEGDLVPTLERILPKIGHIQFADTPGRREPGTGEINFPFVFDALDRFGYDGWVGAEYFPGQGRATEETLDWFAPYRKR